MLIKTNSVSSNIQTFLPFQQTVCLYEQTTAAKPKLQLSDIKQNTAKI